MNRRPDASDPTDVKSTTPRDPEKCGDQPPIRDRDRVHYVEVLGARDILPVRGRRDEKIAMIAETQRGRVARRQLLAAGIREGAIKRMLDVGRLHRLHAGVYAVGHLAPIDLGPETAAALACPGAALSRHTAAPLWKLRPANSASATVELTSLRDQRRRPGIRVHRTRWLDPQDVRQFQGLPVTSPARTLLDIASVLGDRQLERALNEGLVQGTVRISDCLDVLSRARTLPGAPRLRQAIQRRNEPTITRSEAEERFLALIRSALLPAPEVNASVQGFEVDFLWREQRFVVEVDGYAYHGNRRAFERDRRKDAVLRAAGLSSMRVTWMQMQDEPYAVIANVARALVWAEARDAA